MAFLNSQTLFKELRDYVMIAFGLALYAFGFTAFILPEEVVTGGVTGLSSLLYFGLEWNLAISYYAINLILLAIAFHAVGRQFVVRTIIGATFVTLLIGILQPIFAKPIVNEQPFMNIIIGSIFCGLGVGLVFIHNGSTAGTDIVAAVFAKHTTISFGRVMIYLDVVIISSSFFIFHDIEKIVYGLVVMLICSTVIDMVINNNRQSVQFMIFSEKWEDIANAINNEAHRGCTLLHGTGWYTKHDVKILLVVCRKYESIHVQRIIKAIDNEAFITQANVAGVYGQGFDKIKVRLHKHQSQLSDENTPHLSDTQS